MKKQILKTLSALAIVAAAGPAGAVLLDIQNPGTTGPAPVPQTFGDTSFVNFTWDPRMSYWPGGYSGQDAFYCEQSSSRGANCLFRIQPLASTAFITLNYFTLGGYGQRNIAWNVVDLTTSLQTLSGNEAVGASPVVVNVGQTSTAGFEVRFGPDGYEGGLLNVSYDVPEPGSLALLSAALFGLALSRRRR